MPKDTNNTDIKALVNSGFSINAAIRSMTMATISFFTIPPQITDSQFHLLQLS